MVILNLAGIWLTAVDICWSKSWMVFGCSRQGELELHPALATYSHGIQPSSEVEDHQARVLSFQEEENCDPDKMCYGFHWCSPGVSLGLRSPGFAGCSGGSLVSPAGPISALQFVLCPGVRTNPKQGSHCLPWCPLSAFCGYGDHVTLWGIPHPHRSKSEF